MALPLFFVLPLVLASSSPTSALLGANFVPSDAINQLAMFSALTFNPDLIDFELSLAPKAGVNTMRVFLHHALFGEDEAGFLGRVDKFLSIAARHGVSCILVLFDSCWDPDHALGPQRPPIPGVHNSGWVQSPGREMTDPSKYGAFREYVVGVVSRFGNDSRVVALDVWNEPDNTNVGSYSNVEPANKVALVEQLLPQVFQWARSANPSRPLTSPVWYGQDLSNTSTTLTRTQKIQLESSDWVSFHSYDFPELFRLRADQLKTYGKPVLCTEYMARMAGSMIDNILPVGRSLGVGMVSWGWVNGATQTHLPWDSWNRPYVLAPPTTWFHDLFLGNGVPFREAEIDMLKG